MTVYFLIPASELKQAHISLSVSPFVAITDLSTRTISGATYYMVEADSSRITHDVFVDYKPYEAQTIQSATPEKSKGERADFIGVFNQAPAANQATTYDYDMPADRTINTICFEALTFTRGDTITIVAKVSNGQGGWITVNSPVTGYYVQSGVYRLSFPETAMVTGIRISLTYTNTSAIAAAAFTMNFEQFINW